MPHSKSPIADNKKAIRAALLEGAWFAGLPEDTQSLMIEKIAVRKFDPGEALYQQGESPKGIFGIASGQVQTHGTAEDGKVSLLSVHRAGEWTGFLGLFDSRPYAFTVSASVETVAVFLPKIEMDAIFSHDLELVRKLSAPLLHILRFAYGYLINTNGRSPKRVVAQRLLDLGRCAYSTDTTQVALLDAISQDDVADASYLTRPTVNRILANLAKQGAIRLGYGKIELIDVPKLFALASGRRALETPRLKGEAAAARAPWAERAPSPKYAPSPEQVLRAGGWFPSLPKSIQDEIVSALIIRRFKSGEEIYSSGDKCLGLYVLIDGQCRVTGHGVDHGTVLMSLFQPGEWTGFIPLLDKGVQPFTVTASRASTVALLPAHVVERLFFKSVQSYQLLLRPALAILHYTYEYLIESNHRSPARLVAQRLFDMARSAYLPEISTRAFVDNLTQNDIAMATGLSRPTVNRVFADFTQRGLVELGYGKIRICNPQALIAVARDANA